MAIENRTLKVNEKFVATFRGTKYTLQAVTVEKAKTGDKQKATFRMIEPTGYKGAKHGSAALQGGEDGKTFSSLSSAASALAFPGRWDGWKFWTREKEWKPELAIKARGEAAKGKPRPAKAKAPKAASKTSAKSSKETATASPKATPKAKAASGATSPKRSSAKASIPVTPKTAKVPSKSPKASRGSTKSAAKPVTARNGSSPAANSRKTADAKPVATATRGRGVAVAPADLEDDIF